jgi:hypothetical protein
MKRSKSLLVVAALASTMLVSVAAATANAALLRQDSVDQFHPSGKLALPRKAAVGVPSSVAISTTGVAALGADGAMPVIPDVSIGAAAAVAAADTTEPAVEAASATIVGAEIDTPSNATPTSGATGKAPSSAGVSPVLPTLSAGTAASSVSAGSTEPGSQPTAPAEVLGTETATTAGAARSSTVATTVKPATSTTAKTVTATTEHASTTSTSAYRRPPSSTTSTTRPRTTTTHHAEDPKEPNDD